MRLLATRASGITALHHPAGDALEREIAEESEDLKLIKVFPRTPTPSAGEEIQP